MDSTLVTSVAVSLLVQALLSVAFAGTLLHHHRISRRPYLRRWGWSWAALAAATAAAAAAVGAAVWVDTADAPAFLWLLPAGFASSAGLVSLVMLVLGARRLVPGYAPSRTVERLAIAAAAGAGLGAGVLLASAGGPAVQRAALASALRAPVAAALFAVAAVMAWRSGTDPERRPKGWATALLVTALAAYAVQMAHVSAHALYHLVSGSAPLFAGVLGMVDLALLGLVGFAMVAWLLEEQEGRLGAAVRRVEYLGSHDPLTGLPNRHLFLASLRAAALDRSIRWAEPRGQAGSGLAVLCVDLQGFKWINESMGHRVGDRVLCRVADRLSEAASSGGAEVVARLGGDEFAVLLPGTERRQQVRSLGTRILERLAEPIEIGGRRLTAVGRVGFSVAPDDTDDPELLLTNAGAALAAAGQRGRLMAWEPSLRVEEASGFAIEGELRAALDGGELRLAYQPILDLRSRRVDRVEALLRWEHPERGLLSPGEFLHAAEPAGLTEEIDLWSLERALDDLGRWQGQGLDELRVAVNVSPRNFRQPHLPGEIRRMLRRAGVAPEKLELEITEAAAVEIGGASLEVLQVLDELGVGFSLDDFGTGYSSLDYLRRLPVDTVKIDRSFVQDLGGRSEAGDIIRAVINLGRDLGFTVVAEGVESDLQWRLLEELRCDQVQGFALSPPLTAEELPGMLRELEEAPPPWRFGGGVA